MKVSNSSNSFNGKSTNSTTFLLEKQENFVIEHRQFNSRITDVHASESVTWKEVAQSLQQLIYFHAQLVIL